MKLVMDNEEFLFEQVDRYKLTVEIDGKDALQTGNNLDIMKAIYDELVTSSIDDTRRIVISIFDYDKDTDVYFYDSEDERC